jgi:multiple sugar transport system substrate-binding protein
MQAMKTEITMTAMANEGEEAASLRRLLEEFERRHRIHVRLELLSYDEAWAHLVRFAIHSHGPDVSQVGSTWVGNLISMNALRQFTDRETAELGGASLFLPSLWRGGMSPRQTQPWAIPWLAGARLIYYRRDWLEKAGVAEATAFESARQLEQTLKYLQTNGAATPWVAPTGRTNVNLHNLASWVWSAGSDFVSADGKKVLFTEPQALDAIMAYFDLHCYLPVAHHPIGNAQAMRLFMAGEAAVTLAGTWPGMTAPWSTTVDTLKATSSAAADAQRVGMALPLGVPFTGAEYLAVWRHSRRSEAAVELVKFLTSRSAQTAFPPKAGLLPVRIDSLSEPPFTNHPVYQLMARALEAGRSYPLIPRWGLIEDYLEEALGRIWTEVMADARPDVEAVVRRHIEPLAHQMDMILSEDRLTA